MDRDEIRRALEAKGADADCPACGANDWGIVEPGGAVDLPYRALTTTDFVTVAMMLCGNCGFLKMHRTETLLGEPRETWERNPPAPF